MKNTIRNLTVLALGLFVALPAAAFNGPVTLFTYQGFLSRNGSPVNEVVGVRYRLYDDSGTILGEYPLNAGVSILLDPENGRFSVDLVFDNEFFDGRRLYLETVVEGVALSPRQELTATPFALKVPGQSIEGEGTAVNLGHGLEEVRVGDGVTPTDFIVARGRLGIGTSTPAKRLHIVGAALPLAILEGGSSSGVGLELRNTSTGGGDWTFRATGENGGTSLDAGAFALESSSLAGPALVVDPEGNLGVGVPDPTEKLDVAGGLRLRGADIVEGFQSASGAVIEPGTVVSIDSTPGREGALTPSRSDYDRAVAGVVSGAGGIPHGMNLAVAGRLDGDTKLAMTGRVYVKCTTEGGPILPGDRLTSASEAGHAMKVTNRARAHGAVIGKAMSSLEEGTGLVLVLVNLQ